ncbi:MAG: chromosome segregation protein SMC, partial [Lachnospiraceae bacterium]|nr:chromosome segregation protein SMC [Lachnospiraceae bacterium]
LKTADVNCFLLQHKQVTEELDQLGRNLEIAQVDLTSAKTQYEAANVEYDHIQERLAELDALITQMRDKISRTNLIRGQLEGDIKLYEEQINSARTSAEHMRQRQNAVTEELARHNAEKDRILGEKNAVDADLAGLLAQREEAASAQQELAERIRSLSDEINEKKDAILRTLNERAAIKSRLASLTTQEEQMAVRKAELTSRLVQVRTDESRQDEVIQDLQTRFDALAKEIEDLNAEKAAVEESIAGKKTVLSQTDEQMRAAEFSYQQEKARLDSLANLTERYEGFGNSVKRVMEHKQQEPGLIGVVADLIKTDSRYETAIEVALGGNIQNVVTEDEATAKRMIEMLKREKGGRATFLPLTTIRNQQEFKAREILKEPGVIGMADQLVRTEDRFQDVAAALLGRVVIVDTFDHAVKATAKFHHTVRVVTLEGELFAPGGAISGGAFRNSSNLLGRRREMAELEEKVKKWRTEADRLRKVIEDTKAERNNLRARLETIRMTLQSRFLEQNTTRVNIIQEQEKKESAADDLELLRDESASIEKKTEEIRGEKQKIAAALEESVAFENEAGQSAAQQQSQLEVLRQEEEQKAAVVSSWDIEISKIRQKESFAAENLSRIDEEVQRSEAELQEILENLKKCEEDIAFREKNIEETRKTIESSHGVQDEDEQTLQASTQEKAQMTTRQREVYESRGRLSDTISGLEKELVRLTTRKEHIEEQIDTQIHYMWDEYEITLSDAKKIRNEELTDLEALKETAADLKKQIRELGSVNVNAIEEYREVSERYSFMKEQYDDLVSAAKALEDIIAELDDSMRRQFRQQFARITKEFDKVFKELFGGGTGTLELMEDADILEAGVRVIAQPPGKKLQNMMQMSGGEKALTAIALLFAIQNLKPSPFCLLDEIEAALDESNVGRFAQYLHKLTKYTQFIVITHRRGTMEQADRLYGITMQEKGVSALVSVNLIEKDLSA